jgi:hypothetical protein
MRASVRGALIALLLSALSSAALAAGNGTGTATIIQPLTVTANTTLRFGTLVRPAAGSATAVISTAGVFSGTASAVASGPQGNADFTVSGEGGQSVTVSVDASFNMTGPGAAIAVTTTATNTGSHALSGSLGSAGALDVAVGGSIAIPSTQLSGAYSGTFNVTATYN